MHPPSKHTKLDHFFRNTLVLSSLLWVSSRWHSLHHIGGSYVIQAIVHKGYRPRTGLHIVRHRCVLILWSSNKIPIATNRVREFFAWSDDNRQLVSAIVQIYCRWLKCVVLCIWNPENQGSGVQAPTNYYSVEDWRLSSWEISWRSKSRWKKGMQMSW